MDLEGSDTIHQEQQTKEVPLFFSGVWREVERVGVKTMPREFHERVLHQQSRIMLANEYNFDILSKNRMNVGNKLYSAHDRRKT